MIFNNINSFVINQSNKVEEFVYKIVENRDFMDIMGNKSYK